MGNRRFSFVIEAFYLLGVGVLVGMLIERVRFDDARSVLLKQLDQDRNRLHGRLMAIEREAAVERKEIRNDSSIE